jgi:hypothetical protein
MKNLISFRFRKRQSEIMLENCELFKIRYSNLVVDYKSLLGFYTQNFAFVIYFR